MENVLSPIKNGIGAVFNTASNACYGMANALNNAASIPYYQPSVFYGFGMPWGCCHHFNWMPTWGFPSYNFPFGGGYSCTPFNGLGIYNEPYTPIPDFSSGINSPINSIPDNKPNIDYTTALTTTPINVGVSSYENPFCVPIYGSTQQELNSILFGSYRQPSSIQLGAPNYAPVQSHTLPFRTGMSGLLPSVNGFTPEYYLHPERYQQSNPLQNNNTTKKASSTQNNDAKLEKTQAAADIVAVQIPRDKLDSINDKLKEGKSLTKIEQTYFNFYQNVFTQYPMNEMDIVNGSFKSNNPKTRALISKFDAFLLHRADKDKFMSLIEKCTPEELAMIDYHWVRYVNMKIKAGQATPELADKTFRSLARKSCQGPWTRWMNKHNENIDKIMKMIDDKTINLSPRSLAYAFYQSFTETTCDIGIDKEYTTKLLKVLADNPEIVELVESEYAAISGNDSLVSNIKDRLGSFTDGAEFKTLCNKIWKVYN